MHNDGSSNDLGVDKSFKDLTCDVVSALAKYHRLLDDRRRAPAEDQIKPYFKSASTAYGTFSRPFLKVNPFPYQHCMLIFFIASLFRIKTSVTVQQRLSHTNANSTGNHPVDHCKLQSPTKEASRRGSGDTMGKSRGRAYYRGCGGANDASWQRIVGE